MVVGDEDGGAGDTELTTELRKTKTQIQQQKTTIQPKTCLCASETKH